MGIDMPRIGDGVLVGLDAGPEFGLRKRRSATTEDGSNADIDGSLIGAAGGQHFKEYGRGLGASFLNSSLHASRTPRDSITGRW